MLIYFCHHRHRHRHHQCKHHCHCHRHRHLSGRASTPLSKDLCLYVGAYGLLAAGLQQILCRRVPPCQLLIEKENVPQITITIRKDRRVKQGNNTDKKTLTLEPQSKALSSVCVQNKALLGLRLRQSIYKERASGAQCLRGGGTAAAVHDPNQSQSLPNLLPRLLRRRQGDL